MSILCYHSVEPGWSSPLAVLPESFERHCGWLATNRRVVGLADAVARVDRRGRPPRGMAALTFDDGFRALHRYALPALRRHSLPATVFVVARTLMGDTNVDWVDTPPPSGRLETLGLDEVLELKEAGVEIGSHSYAHHDLTTLSDGECEADLRQSREVLEDLLQARVPFVAYPRGRHDERVRRAAARAGFTHGFSLPERPEPAGPYAIPRVGIFPGNELAALRVKTMPSYLGVRTSAAFPALRRLARRPPPSRLPG